MPGAPGSPTTGQMYYDTGTNVLYWWNGTSWIPAQGGAGSAAANTVTITQAAHGFTVGNLIYYTGTAYAKALADSSAHAEVVGIVSVVVDANNFVLLTDGKVTGLSGLTAGAVYFLSPTTAGALTVTEPSTNGQISKPIMVADTTTSAFFFNWRGQVIGFVAGGAGAANALKTGDLVWQVGTTRVGAVLANGATYDGTNALYTPLWTQMGSPAPQNAFVVPDLRDRVPIGAGGNTALRANDGVPAANRVGTRHRHTPHLHTYVAQAAAGTGSGGGIGGGKNDTTTNTSTVDGGSGVVTDPLDGPGYVALNPFIIL